MQLFELWLRTVGRLVPSERRREWRSEWLAEMATLRRADAGRFERLQAGAGALPDAIWHFFDEWSLDTMLQDLRHALRSLRRRLPSTLVAVVVLALGLSAAVVVFSAFDAVVLRPLPYSEPDRLVALWEKNPIKGWDRQNLAPANFLDWRQQSETLGDMAAYGSGSFDLILSGAGILPRRVSCLTIESRFFAVLGVPLALGHGFNEDDDWGLADRAVILGHEVWQQDYGGDPGIVERTIHLEGLDMRVVGVAAEGFAFPQPIDVYMPLRTSKDSIGQPWFRRAHYLRAIARLAPGRTLEEARTELAAIAARLEAQYPDTNTAMGSGATPLHEWVVGDTRKPLALVALAVGLLLAIAAANVASLLLLGAGQRHREIAVRAALGAGRRRLVRLLFTEGALLAAVAVTAGVYLARIGLRLVVLHAEGVPRLAQATVDLRALLAAVAVTAVATIGFSLVPAVLGSRADLRASLHAGSLRGSASGSQVRARSVLVVAEVALSAVLVIAAGLLVRSFALLYSVDPGFDARDVLAVRVNVPAVRYQEEPDVEAFYEQLVERAEALPGVTGVALSQILPIGDSSWTTDFALVGQEGFGVEARHVVVDERYLETLGVPLLAGRDFAASDRSDAPQVVLVNRRLLRDLLADSANPGQLVGRQICTSRDCTEAPKDFTVVGVVEDTHFDGLASEPRPLIYHPIRQNTPWDREILLRSAGDPNDLVAPMAAIVRRLDAELPLMRVRTLDEVISGTLRQERFLTTLLAGFGLVALLLAVVGLFGVLATVVSLRRRELGIRAALGAARPDLVGLVMRQGILLLSFGLAIGLGLAAAAGGWLEGLLFQVHRLDLATYAAVSSLLLAAGLLATWLPARRASQVDPVTVLRAE